MKSSNHAVSLALIYLMTLSSAFLLNNRRPHPVDHQNHVLPGGERPRRRRPHLDMSTSSSISDAARGLLYQDQQEAMLRRSLEEEALLAPRTSTLQAPKLKVETTTRGTGFAVSSAKSTTAAARLAAQQARVLKQDGVILVEDVLSAETADRLRSYVLEQQELARVATEWDPTKARSFYGVEQARAHRCDLQLSLLRGGYKVDDIHGSSSGGAGTAKGAEPLADEHVLADALQEVLGEDGSLRHLYETLVTKKGEFYELAAVVTHPGSQRQMVHPDLPFQKTAPLYVVFLALQDVTEEMGPTSFLLKTHTASHNAQFTSGNLDVKNAQLSESDCRLACLRRGDAVVFDARILHCGNANSSVDRPRALFNFSFRNPQVGGSLGYEGSIRPGYCRAMSLEDVGDALLEYQNGNTDPFLKYGSGLL